MATLLEKLQDTPEGRRCLQQERVILELTETVCGMMGNQHVSKSELARRLGKTEKYVTLLLDGHVNVTIRTISDIFLALGYEFRFQCTPI